MTEARSEGELLQRNLVYGPERWNILEGKFHTVLKKHLMEVLRRGLWRVDQVD